MWFDNLTPEQIQERLRKEGLFAPLLERLGLNQDEEEDEKGVLTPEEERGLLAEAVDDLLLPRIRGITAPQVVKEVTFKYILADRGNGALEPLMRAKHSIYATHFTPAQFSARYVALQRQKVEDGLIFERLVYFHQKEKAAGAYEWLNDFFHPNGFPKKHYRQYQIEQIPLPLLHDFMVIDEKWVLFWYKNGDEPETFIVGECEVMAKDMVSMWKAITGCKSQKLGAVLLALATVMESELQSFSKIGG